MSENNKFNYDLPGQQPLKLKVIKDVKTIQVGDILTEYDARENMLVIGTDVVIEKIDGNTFYAKQLHGEKSTLKFFWLKKPSRPYVRTANAVIE